jgi:hypothetical protein
MYALVGCKSSFSDQQFSDQSEVTSANPRKSGLGHLHYPPPADGRPLVN